VRSDVRQRLGRLGEQLASEHLARLGFDVVERNYRTRWGELDIVASDGHTLVFCEVKTRRLSPGGAEPLDAVNARKQRQVRRMAMRWLNERADRPHFPMLRFDAIAVILDHADGLVSLEHLEGAF
jgi:putative endonuclease